MKIVDRDNIQIRKPKWLKRRLPRGPEYERMKRLINNNSLTTVCQEAKCPNQFECFSKGTATFMILGERCTRNCGFCAISHKPLSLPDPGEPSRVAEAVASLHLKYAVITSVTRDDLPDGGASLFSQTIQEVHRKSPGTLIEILIPDLQGNWTALAKILQASPDVLNHNLETVPRLYSRVRPEAVYERSLELLRHSKILSSKTPTKSGVMLGLGETRDQVEQVLKDLRDHDVDMATIGQYLQPTPHHHPVLRYWTPEEFEELAKLGYGMGFTHIASGPLVRSSYHADLMAEESGLVS